MTKEIKEIIDKLNNKAEHYILYNYEVKLLLDYITNLQEENNYYFKKNNELSILNTSLRSDRDNYKSRNEKAIEYIKQYKELDFSDLDLLNILQGSDKE